MEDLLIKLRKRIRSIMRKLKRRTTLPKRRTRDKKKFG